jgi:hypothetical protein
VRPGRAWLLVVPVLVGLITVACGSATQHAAAPPSTRAASTTTAPAPDVHVSAASFRALRHMTPVRNFFVANLNGNLTGTLAVAHSANGGRYPVGTVIQLVPTEAMVKHRAGYDAATDDWEFFSLAVSPAGTKILRRGTNDVVNAFGANCFSCHSAAASKFDFVCEHDHGCAPLPIGDNVIRAVQHADPRP